MEDQNQIIEKIVDIRKNYTVELENEKQEELSFFDKINDLIRAIFKDPTLNIYYIFSPSKLEEWKKKRFSRFIKQLVIGNFKSFLYFCLLVTIICFLVSEALDFYAIDSVISKGTYLKAILTEVSFIFLSGYRASGRLQTVAVGLLRVSIFALMLFVITSKTFTQSTAFSGNTDSIASQVVLIEQQVQEKESLIKYYQEKNWPITTKQLVQEKNELLKQLIDLKKQQASGATVEMSQLVQYKAYGNAVFRVILLFISILITRRIFSF